MSEIEYMTPENLEEVFEAAEKRKGLVKFIAGCTNVIPYIRAEILSPELLIDISSLEGLNYIREENGSVSMGALTTISEIVASDIIRSQVPILYSAACNFGSPLTRNRATIGGNLADASPAADMALPLLALESVIHTRRSGRQEREVSLDEFFLGPNKTVLADDELITQIAFAKPKGSAKGSYFKLGLRNAMTISLVSIAVVLEMEEKVCKKARVTLGAVAPTPIRAYQVEKNLEGREIDKEIIQECSDVIKEEISPISDIRASAEYRKFVTSVLFKRAIQEAIKGEKI